MREFEARLAASIRRAPYVWAVLIFLVLLITATSMDTIRPKHPDEWIGWVAAGFIVYSVVGTLVFMPRFFVGPLKRNEDRLLLMRWILAITPFMIGIAATAYGAYLWILSLGMFATLVLLSVAALATKNVRPTRSKGD